jgi:hypothetical protein
VKVLLLLVASAACWVEAEHNVQGVEHALLLDGDHMLASRSDDGGRLLPFDAPLGVATLVANVLVNRLLPVGSICPSGAPALLEGGQHGISEEEAIGARPEDRAIAKNPAAGVAFSTVADAGDSATSADDLGHRIVDGGDVRALAEGVVGADGRNGADSEAGDASALQLCGGHARHLRKEVGRDKLITVPATPELHERISGPLSGRWRNSGQRCTAVRNRLAAREPARFVLIGGVWPAWVKA